MDKIIKYGVAVRAKKANKKLAKAITLIMLLATLLVLTLLVLTPGSSLERIVAGIMVLMLTGELVRRVNRLDGAYGIYLLGSKHGTKAIDSLAATSKAFWKLLAKFGFIFSFGLLSNKLVKDKRLLAIGIIALLAIDFFVFPNLGIMLEFMPFFNSRLAEAQATSTSASLAQANAVYALILISTFIGGFALLTISLLAYSGVSIVYTIAYAVSTSKYSQLASTVPGVVPVIPGITIPLAAGIISLALLLVIHEFSHGVLARLAKVKIRSIGIVLFGIVPFGAFVEPDEKEVNRLNKEKQNEIFVAGISSNILASVLFFFFTLLMVDAVLPAINTYGVKVLAVIPNTPANTLLKNGTVLLKWNNVPITNAYILARLENSYTGGNVTLSTSNGTISIKPMPDGRLGIELGPAKLTIQYNIAYFLLEVFALSFALNFFVGIFNLLPLPGFDGWRIYKNQIRNKNLLNIMLAIVIASILLNLLPWLWAF